MSNLNGISFCLPSIVCKLNFLVHTRVLCDSCTIYFDRDVVEAEKIRLDRWTVVIKPDEAEKDAQKKQLQIQANAANTNEDTSRIFVMNNYFGLGIDADLNLDFHMAREENPAKFNSR